MDKKSFKKADKALVEAIEKDLSDKDYALVVWRRTFGNDVTIECYTEPEVKTQMERVFRANDSFRAEAEGWIKEFYDINTQLKIEKREKGEAVREIVSLKKDKRFLIGLSVLLAAANLIAYFVI